jgi:plasmid stabilization system protein ParE
MKLRFTQRAIENISGVANYLRTRNPVAAERVQSDIYDGLQNLILFPRVGRRQNVPGVRRIVTRKYSYLVYYMIDDEADEVVILNIKHPASKREYSDF